MKVGSDRAILLAIVAAGILIRVPGLLHDGLWRDEAYVYVDVIAPTFGSFFHRVILTEYHPPLYFLISYAWLRMAGVSELSLKLLPFCFSIFTIAAVYRLGKVAGSTGIGLVAAAMYAVSPLAILESGDYLYPLMTLLCTALAALVMAGRREPVRPVSFIAIAAVTALTVYTHYDALFYVPMLGAWTLCSPRGARHGITLVGALALGALTFLFWLPTFLREPNPYFIKPPSNPGNPLFVPPPNALEKLAFFTWTLVRSMPLWPEVLAIVLCAFFAVALVTLAASRRVNADALAMGLIYAVALGLISGAGRLNIRYVAPFEGLFCVFLAWVLAAWLQRVRLEHPFRWGSWGVALTATLGAFIVAEDVVFAAHTARMPKSGIRTFVMSRPLDQRTLYVVVPDYMTATFVFYARESHAAYTAFPRTDHPEVYRYGTDATFYGPAAVADGTIELAKKARDFSYIDLIVDDVSDSEKVMGGILYRSAARTFLDAVKARYQLVAQTHYPGRLEAVTVYRLRTGDPHVPRA